VDDDVAVGDHRSEIIAQIDLADDLQLRKARRASDECLAHAAFGAGYYYFCHSKVMGFRAADYGEILFQESQNSFVNRKVGRAVLCAPTPATTLSYSAKDGAHGVTRPTLADRFHSPHAPPRSPLEATH